MIRFFCLMLLLVGGLQIVCAQGALYPVRVNHKWGYINRFGKIAFVPKYDFIGDSPLPWNVQHPANLPAESPFKMVELNGKVGLINGDLVEILPCKYLRIRPLSKRLFAVEIDSLFTVVDAQQHVLLNARYENICPLNTYNKSKEQYVLVQQNRHWGVHQLEGGLVIPIQYKSLEEVGQGYFKFQEERDTFYGLLAPDSRPVLPAVYKDIKVLRHNFIAVTKGVADGWQILNEKGDTVMGAKWSYLRVLNKRIVALHELNDVNIKLWDLNAKAFIPAKDSYRSFDVLDESYFCYTVPGRMKGIMDSLGRKVTNPIYQQIDTIGLPDHFLVVNGAFLQGIFSPGKGEVLPCKYKWIQAFSGHFAFCKGLLGFGAIDRNFEEVIPCQYSSISREENSILRAYNGDNTSVDFYYQPDGQIKGSSRNGQIIQIYFDTNAGNDFGISEAQPKTYKDTTETIEYRISFPNFITNKDSSFAWREVAGQHIWELLQRTGNQILSPVKTKAVYKHVIEMVPEKLAAVYPNRQMQNDFTAIFGDGLCRMSFFDLEKGKHISPLNMLGCRDFQENVPYTAFIDTSGRMGLIDRVGRQLLKSDSTPLRFTYIGRFSKGRARVCVGGEIRFAHDADEEEEKLSLGNQYLFTKEFNLRKPVRKAADEDEFDPHTLVAAAKGREQAIWGYVDLQGNFALEPTHYFLKDFRKDSLAIYINNDSAGVGRYGVLNFQFQPIIPAKYNAISSYFQDFKVAVKNPYLFYFNQKGYEIHKGMPPKRTFSEGLCQVNNGYVWGYINLDGIVKIPFQFDSTRSFSNGLAAVVDTSGQWVFVDTVGQRRFSTGFAAKRYLDFGRFSNGRCRFRVGKFWGYYDLKGNQAIAPTYARATEFSFGAAVVHLPGSAGEKPAVIDTAGNFIIKPGLYDDIHPFDNNGLAIARRKKGGLYGLINTQGDSLTAFKYNQIKPFIKGYAQVSIGTQTGLINLAGKEVIRPQFYKMDQMSEGLVAVLKTIQDKRWVYVDSTGREAVNGAYEQTTPFADGVALVNGRNIIDRTGMPGLAAFAFGEGVFCMKTVRRNTYFADAAGNNIFGRMFTAAGPFRFGVAKAYKNNAWGAINRRGVFVVPPKFKEVFPQPDGNIHVRPKYLYGLIDKKGNVLFEPTYDLVELYPSGVYRLELGEMVGYRFRDGGDWLWPMGK
ncbi:MAG: WG repeat-containing protein [Bacteroidota bacterium]